MAGVKHVIWSTLEDTRLKVPLKDTRMPTLMERYKVPHFDAKGESDKLFMQAGTPTTCLRTSFFWENFIYFGLGPRKLPDGTLALTLPMGTKKLPGIASEDVGRCAYGIFRKGLEYIGQTVGIAGEHLTGAQMAAAMSRSTALGPPHRITRMPCRSAAWSATAAYLSGDQLRSAWLEHALITSVGRRSGTSSSA